MIVCPWQKQVSPITAFCTAQLNDKRRTTTLLNFGDAFVAHSRNSCVDVFLGSDLDYMLTIDDDMIVPFGNANWFKTYTGWSDYPEPFASFNAIDRLMSHEKTLVGALYFGKHRHGNPTYNEGAANKTEGDFARKGPHNLIKPTRWVGTGCMLIHREVFLAIEKRFPNLRRGPDGKGGQWFTSSEHHAMDDIRRVREFLEKGPHDGSKSIKAYEMILASEAKAKANSSLGMGEDVQFCIRAAESGHQPFIDMGLICGHLGTYCYGPYNTTYKVK